MSVALDIIHYSKRVVKQRGSTIYKEGDQADRTIHLLLSGTVSISRRFQLLYSDHAEMSVNKDMSLLYNPKIDFRQKVIAIKSNGEFLEEDIMQMSGKRTESAMVESEAALVIIINMNLLLSLDRVYSQINAVQDVMAFKEHERNHLDERVDKMGVAKSVTVKASKQDIPEEYLNTGEEPLPTGEEFNRMIKIGWNSYKEKEVRFGYNTLITRVGRSRDRSLASKSLEKRAERQKFAESPLNYTSNTINRPKRDSIDQSLDLGKHIKRNQNPLNNDLTSFKRESKAQVENSRIQKLVMDRLDRDDIEAGGDINPICSPGLKQRDPKQNRSSRRSRTNSSSTKRSLRTTSRFSPTNSSTRSSRSPSDPKNSTRRTPS